MKLQNIFFLSFVLLFVFNESNAQLGFCSGNSGDPIFIDTFGTGVTTSLPKGTTTYTYRSNAPSDGFYNISKNSYWHGWHNIKDHTKGDTGGRMLIVNADLVPGEFYVTKIEGLCENTTYEFSSWLINLLPSYGCSGFGIPINVSFEIWDGLDQNLLASGDTGSIKGTPAPVWKQYALVFQTLPSQTSVILKMRNNGAGGCGNDLAIDDIMFRTCGDNVIVKDSFNNTENFSIYEEEFPYSITLTAIPDSLIFSTHFYQWQESENGVDWINIAGENNNKLSRTNINCNMFYRVLISENATNLVNALCNIASEVFEVKIAEPTETRKKVTVVKNGLDIIYDKVWIDDKYVQTGEEIIKQGGSNDVVIEETIYKKARYGYNSITRTYRIQKSSSKGKKN